MKLKVETTYLEIKDVSEIENIFRGEELPPNRIDQLMKYGSIHIGQADLTPTTRCFVTLTKDVDEK